MAMLIVQADFGDKWSKALVEKGLSTPGAQIDLANFIECMRKFTKNKAKVGWKVID